MPFGPPGKVSLVLNIDSLWSGGLFENSVGTCSILYHITYSFSISCIQEAIQWNRRQKTCLAFGNGYFAFHFSSIT
jgi:hypothetical protein